MNAKPKPKPTPGELLTTYWPIIIAVVIVVAATGRADSAIQTNARDIQALQQEDRRQADSQAATLKSLGRIEGKVDVLIQRVQ